MTNVKANIKEGLGYAEEESGEALKNKKMMEQGRNLRNEGRIEKGELPKMTKPGTTGHHDRP